MTITLLIPIEVTQKLAVAPFCTLPSYVLQFEQFETAAKLLGYTKPVHLLAFMLH